MQVRVFDETLTEYMNMRAFLLSLVVGTATLGGVADAFLPGMRPKSYHDEEM